jgi:hypothetical protein
MNKFDDIYVYLTDKERHSINMNNDPSRLLQGSLIGLGEPILRHTPEAKWLKHLAYTTPSAPWREKWKWDEACW